MNAHFSGSYEASDVCFLLKRVAAPPVDVVQKEHLIQSGQRHYSEMFSLESAPSADYLALYHDALARNGARLAADIASLAATLDARQAEGREIVLVSLVRAGTPIGILIARALRRLGRQVAHYGVSIIRDRGIDLEALAHIASHHDPSDIVFVDGWTGKGAIASELRSSCRSFDPRFTPYLIVVADPAGHADLAATHDDYLIASGLLNGVVSGLISRSLLSADHVGPGEFHACVQLDMLAARDHSRAFVGAIDALMPLKAHALQEDVVKRAEASGFCNNMVTAIMAETGIKSRNFIKPGIAEATRVLLRRVPDRLYIRDEHDPDVAHLLYLATEKGVPILPMKDAGHFRAVAVIKAVDA